MNDPTLLALLLRMDARLSRIEERLAIAPCPLTEALGQTFGDRAFTAREAIEKAAKLASRDRSNGRDPGGLPKALEDARLTSPHAFARWAQTAPALEAIGKDCGVVLWRVSQGVNPLVALLRETTPRENHEASPRRASTGERT